MRKRNLFCYFAVGCLMTLATAWAIQVQVNHDSSTDSQAVRTNHVASTSSGKRYPVLIRTPLAPLGVDTGRFDYQGNVIRLACRSCHDVRPANVKNAAAGDLNEFHQGLVFNHGKLACVACHNTTDGYTTLHLADGSALEYGDTMKLCGQCHGSQFRDYQQGAHGGMTGYWDLSKGPRQRNHCVDCHDPHAPQYPVVHPARGPNDRFSPSHKDEVH